MPEPSLITEYLGVLARQLPGPVIEELADGLDETYRRHLVLGLAPDAAAAAAAGRLPWLSLPPNPPPMRRTSTVTAWVGTPSTCATLC